MIYYYCDYADPRTLDSDCVLGTLLKQLFDGGHIPEKLAMQTIRACGDGLRTPGFSELLDLVCAAVGINTTTFVVLDRLDECETPSKRDILEFFGRLVTTGPSIVKLLVSCREEDAVSHSLAGCPRIQLTAALLKSDIESFVIGSVRSRIESTELNLRDSTLELVIVSELVSKAQGMYV